MLGHKVICAETEARVLFAAFFDAPDVRDYVFGVLCKDDFPYFADLYERCREAWMQRKFSVAIQRANVIRNFCDKHAEREAYYRLLSEASRYPCEFIYREEGALLRVLRIRRKEWLMARFIEARVMNTTRPPRQLLMESRQQYDELADIINDSQGVLECLSQGFFRS